MAKGVMPQEAVMRSVETAGRTVLFSALAVAISLAALAIVPLAFLRSFAYAGVAVVVLAAVAALVVLPALLAALGTKVDRLVLFRRRRKPEGTGFWHRVATLVMRRPLVIGGAVVALLLVLGTPFLHIAFGLPDDRVLPQATSSRQVSDQIRTRFSSKEASALTVVAPGIGTPDARAAEINAYAAGLSRLPGAARVDALTGSYIWGVLVGPPGPSSVRFTAADSTSLSVVSSDDPVSDE